MFSRLFSAYYLRKHPEHFVGLNSYAAELAYTLSRASKENYIRAGGLVKDDAAAMKHWETPEGGGLWAAGVGGPITGKGFHLGIIDDPIKNAEEAASEVIREKHKEWYKTTFLSREEPDAAIVIIQTRWHEDDLTGWLLSEEDNADTETEREHWHIVCLPAISEELGHFPASCTLEPDFRKEIGEALCPKRYNIQKLLQKQSKGEYEFGALYQQRPTAKQGLFFHVDKLEIVDTAPVEARRARGWDQSATAGGGDFTAGPKMSKDKEGIFYIEDVQRGQWDTATRDRTIRQTAELDGRGCKQVGEQEPGSGGKGQAENFVRMLAGFPVVTYPATNAKEIRADPFSSQVNAGNVKLVRGAWNKAYIEELRTFPHGKHDDQVDGSSLAFNELNGVQEWSVSRRSIR